jgi:NAD(P)-dependent dehydrogenase (short-subunit alcohol dehydrogenase family)
MSDMKGKICIVTGSNSGIGKETALALVGMGGTVVMAVRSRERGEVARREIVETTKNDSVELMICDVSSVSSIRDFVKDFAGKYSRLDVLINNAGAVFSNRQVTVDGFERTLAVDYLGPFLLTQELLPMLKSSAPSRVINLSSGLAKNGVVNLDDLQSEKNYNGMKVYSNVKLLVLLWTYAQARDLDGTGVTMNAVMPGFVATNLGKSDSRVSAIEFGMVRLFQSSPRKGAETSVYLASSEEVKGLTGKCFRKMKETTTIEASYDRQLQDRLWEMTLKLLRLN